MKRTTVGGCGAGGATALISMFLMGTGAGGGRFKVPSIYAAAQELDVGQGGGEELCAGKDTAKPEEGGASESCWALEAEIGLRLCHCCGCCCTCCICGCWDAYWYCTNSVSCNRSESENQNTRPFWLNQASFCSFHHRMLLPSANRTLTLKHQTKPRAQTHH